MINTEAYILMCFSLIIPINVYCGLCKLLFASIETVHTFYYTNMNMITRYKSNIKDTGQYLAGYKVSTAANMNNYVNLIRLNTFILLIYTYMYLRQANSEDSDVAGPKGTVISGS